MDVQNESYDFKSENFEYLAKDLGTKFFIRLESASLNVS